MKNQSLKTRQHTSEHKVDVDNKYFCDTNIWITIYGNTPLENNPRKSAYEKLVNQMYQKKVEIYIDSLVISEFLNRAMIQAMRLYMKQNEIAMKESDYRKIYRETDDYATNSKEVSNTIALILRNANFIPASASLDINAIIDYFSKNKCDFNDLIIDDLCKRNDYWLITDDGDFSFSSSKIVTYNNKLLT